MWCPLLCFYSLHACMWWWLGDSLCYRQTTSQHNCETVQNFTIERVSHFMLLCSQQRYVGQSNTCAEDEQVVAEYIKLAQVSLTPIYWAQFLEPCLVIEYCSVHSTVSSDCTCSKWRCICVSESRREGSSAGNPPTSIPCLSSCERPVVSWGSLQV